MHTLVHEYFVILLWWRVCVMLLWCMSTLLSYYGGECVLCTLWCIVLCYLTMVESVCYAALVHEYFVILLWWRVCVMHTLVHE